MSAAFSSIAVVIAFLALIWGDKQLETASDAHPPIWDGCCTTLPPRVARHSCANNVGAMKSVSELMKPS